MRLARFLPMRHQQQKERTPSDCETSYTDLGRGQIGLITWSQENNDMCKMKDVNLGIKDLNFTAHRGKMMATLIASSVQRQKKCKYHGCSGKNA